MRKFKMDNEEMLPELKNIMSVCFQDVFEVVDLFFKNRVCLNDCFVCEEDGKIVSVLHIIPSELQINGKIYKSGYIYGACTLPDFRKRGIMSELIKFSEKEAMNRNYKFLFLVPDNESLENFYQKLGYRNFFKHKKIVLKRSMMNKFYNFSKRCKYFNDDIKNISEHMEKLQNFVYNEKNVVLYNNQDFDYAVKLYNFFDGKAVTNRYGYAICTPEFEGLIIRGFTAVKPFSVLLLGQIYKLFPNFKNYILLSEVNNYFFESRVFNQKIQHFGMIKCLDNKMHNSIKNIKNAYLALALD